MHGTLIGGSGLLGQNPIKDFFAQTIKLLVNQVPPSETLSCTFQCLARKSEAS